MSDQPDTTPDYKKCEQVYETVGALMESDPPNIGWMTGELASRLLGAFNAGRTRMEMTMLRAGMDREEAHRQVSMQLPLAAFELGLKVGKEMEAVRQMREMFGEEP